MHSHKRPSCIGYDEAYTNVEIQIEKVFGTRAQLLLRWLRMLYNSNGEEMGLGQFSKKIGEKRVGGLKSYNAKN